MINHLIGQLYNWLDYKKLCPPLIYSQNIDENVTSQSPLKLKLFGTSENKNEVKWKWNKTKYAYSLALIQTTDLETG